MSGLGLAVFDETVHATNQWLKDLMYRLNWVDRGHAYRALRSTLHALRDRLPVNVAASLASQMPMLVRGIYYEGWRPADVPSRDRTSGDFEQHVAEAFKGLPELDVDEIVRAVLGLLDEKISEGEIDRVKKCLPADIRNLWPG